MHYIHLLEKKKTFLKLFLVYVLFVHYIYNIYIVYLILKELIMTLKVVIASDHWGLEFKSELVKYVNALGFLATDLGPFNSDNVDYPDYADKLCNVIKEEQASIGILICGSGIGISIAANRHRHIRCALVINPTEARLSKEHNNANVLALGSKVIDIERAKENVKTFLNTEFEGGRHQIRIDKIS